MWRRKENKKPNRISDALSTRTAKGIVYLQRRWTLFLTRRTMGWSQRSKKIFLLTVILCLGGVSCFVLIKSIAGRSSNQLSRPAEIHFPLMPHEREDLHDQSLFQPADTLILQQFHYLVDSLKTSVSGRAKLEQFMRERPGFMDSLARIERLMKRPIPINY